MTRAVLILVAAFAVWLNNADRDLGDVRRELDAWVEAAR